jgi:hypothetical protein
MLRPTETGAKLPSAVISTVNTAANSKGSIHDDEKAREMGYAGGFVPGVTVLGYMTRLMSDAYGADWLRTGTFFGRLRLPTYANAQVTVNGAVIEPPSAANGDRVRVDLEVLDQDGKATATGSATCVVSR